jgi:LEA14-like dessication related protein
MKIKNILLFFVLVLTFSACKIQQIDIGKPEGLEVEELTMKSVKLKIMVSIKNPNNFAIKVKKVDLDLLVNDRDMGKIGNMEKLNIPANSSETYPVSFELTPKDAVTNILFLMKELQQTRPKLALTGFVKVGAFGLTKKIKVEQEQEFDKF